MTRFATFALFTVLATMTVSDQSTVEAASIPVQTAPVFELLGYQKAVIECPARFTWNNWSRQTGKSTALSLRRLLRGMERRRNQIFLSASEQQSRELMMKARQHCEAWKIAASAIGSTYFEDTSFRQLEITLPNGVRVIGLPANPRTARGFTGDVFLDEFAMHQDDRAIWASVFPSVMRGNGELDVASTPKGLSNIFYMLASNQKFHHHTVTIDDAIRDGLEADREDLREAMGDEELFRQEFLCEFLDEATAYLTYEMIAACEDAQLDCELDLDCLKEVDAKDGDLYVGVDIGRKHDLTVIWVVQEVFGKLVTLGLIELRNVPFRAQYEALISVLDLRCVRRCCIDATGLGMQLAETAQEDFGAYRVEPVTFGQAIKAQMAGDLRIKVEDRSISVPADPRIRNDLHSVKRTVTAAGNVRFEGERNQAGHADRFWAAALAVHAAGPGAEKAECVMGPRKAFARSYT